MPCQMPILNCRKKFVPLFIIRAANIALSFFEKRHKSDSFYKVKTSWNYS